MSTLEIWTCSKFCLRFTGEPWLNLVPIISNDIREACFVIKYGSNAPSNRDVPDTVLPDTG